MKKNLLIATAFFAFVNFSMFSENIWDYERQVKNCDTTVVKEIKKYFEKLSREDDDGGYYDYYDYNPKYNFYDAKCNDETILQKYVRLNDEKVVKFLVTNIDDVLIYSSSKDAVVQTAVQYSSPSMFKLVCSSYKDFTIGLNPKLYYLAKKNQNPEIVNEVLLEIGKSINNEKYIRNVFNFLLNDMDLAKELINIKAFNFNNLYNQQSILSELASFYDSEDYAVNEMGRKRYSIAKWLLENGADVNVVNGEDGSVLAAAVKYSNLEFVELFLKYNADPSIINKYKETPLMKAVNFTEESSMAEEKKKIAELLINTKKGINAVSDSGKTALTIALDKRHYNLAEKLILAGADPNLFGKDEESPLRLACNSKKIELIKMLVERGAKVNAVSGSGKSPALYTAVYRGNLEIVKYLLEHGAKPNLKNKYGNVPLCCVSYEDAEIARLLLKYGANVNIKNNDGETPLTYAFARSIFPVIEVYRDYKPDYKIVGKDGSTLFHYLIEGSMPHEIPGISDSGSYVIGKGIRDVVVKELLDNGVDINARRKDGATALLLACESEFDSAEYVKVLIDNGADINIADNELRTPLMHAIGNPKTLELLLSCGADRTKKNADGLTAYEQAIKIAKLLHNEKYTKCVELLYEEDKADESNISLSAALETGNVVLSKKLIKNCTDINAPDKDGNYPLYSAILSNNPELVKLVLDKKPDLTLVNKKYGETSPLLRATYGRNVQIVTMLLEAGADPNKRCWESLYYYYDSPLYCAIGRTYGRIGYESNLELVKLLIKFGADPNARGGFDNFDNKTDFMSAVSYSSYEIVEYLLANGAEIFVTDETGESPWKAADSEKQKLIKDAANKKFRNQTVNVKEQTSVYSWFDYYRDEMCVLTPGTSVKILEVIPDMQTHGNKLRCWFKVQLPKGIKTASGETPKQDYGWCLFDPFAVK